MRESMIIYAKAFFILHPRDSKFHNIFRFLRIVSKNHVNKSNWELQVLNCIHVEPITITSRNQDLIGTNHVRAGH